MLGVLGLLVFFRVIKTVIRVISIRVISNRVISIKVIRVIRVISIRVPMVIWFELFGLVMGLLVFLELLGF